MNKASFDMGARAMAFSERLYLLTFMTPICNQMARAEWWQRAIPPTMRFKRLGKLGVQWRLTLTNRQAL